MGATFPDTYFDSEQALGDVTTGVLADAGDAYIVLPQGGAAVHKVEG